LKSLSNEAGSRDAVHLMSVMRIATVAACAGVMLLHGGAARAQETPHDFVRLSHELMPAVVNIATTQKVRGLDDIPAFPRGSPLEKFNDELNLDGADEINSLGSGFIIDATGVIVTNNHVIENADKIEVIFADGEQLKAEVIGRDLATDIAVLRVKSARPLPFVKLGDSNSVEIGEWVIAIGNPFGLGASVSAGIISARNRDIGAGTYDDFLQTDAAINRGNSGGPLFSMNGEVIGVNTAIVSPTGASVGVGFAVPSDLVRTVVSQLIQYGETRRGWLGVRLRAVTPEAARRNGLTRPRGALIAGLTEGGPAAKAGLRPGDIVVSYGGKETPETRVLSRLVADTAIGRSMPLEFLRNGKRMMATATVTRLEPSDPAKRPAARTTDPAPDPVPGVAGEQGAVFGMRLAEITRELRRRFRLDPEVNGLVVLSVEAGSPAAGSVQEGDVILEMAFQPVETIAEARAQAARVDKRAPILLYLDRGGDKTFRQIEARK
jgi:serine protease Do